MSEPNMFGSAPDEVAATATEYLSDPKRRRNTLMRLAREEVDAVLRPMIRAEIERMAPSVALDVAKCALAALSDGSSIGYEIRSVTEKAVARAMAKVEFRVEVRP